MKRVSFSHLADQTLLRTLAELVKDDQVSTATILACIAEVDARKLYLAAGYDSMYLFLVHEFHMSEDVAFKRIRAARAGRRFPAMFDLVAEGRLHLSAVVMLSPHLTTENAAELLAAAEHRTKAEIELLLARRFPKPDGPTFVQGLAVPESSDRLAARTVASIVETATGPVRPSEFRQLAPGPVATMFDVPGQHVAAQRVDPTCPHEMTGPSVVQLAPERVVESRARIAPLSPGRFALQVTVDQETHDLLRYAQALLGHSVPSGDMAQVLKRALSALVRELEKQKFAKCDRSRPQRGTAHGRHIPAEVRRLVWQRDGGRCTFVSDHGKRCENMTRLEFDHMDPVARGGRASVARMRLRCRAHNQYEAECAFGAGFMQHKREESRCRAGQARERKQERERTRARAIAQARPAPGAESTTRSDVVPWLRALGFSAEEARRGAALCADMPDARLDQRVRVALRGLAPNCVRRPAPVACGAR